MISATFPCVNTPDPGCSRQPRLLVLGLGNDILSDDAIGLLIVRRLESDTGRLLPVDFRETTEMGLSLLDFMAGYDSVFIVDSILTGKAEPGTVHYVEYGSKEQRTRRTPHFLGVADTLALGAELRIPMPRCVRIFAIEVQDPFTLGTSISRRLEAAFEAIVGQISAKIQDWASVPVPLLPSPPPEVRAEQQSSS